MEYTVTNIIWDTDGETIDLPTEIIITIPNEDFVNYTEDEVGEFISDEITNITGFCHEGYSFK